MDEILVTDAGERAPQRLRQKALDLADDATRRLAEIASDGHKAVHDVRRRLKELRALALLLGSGRGEREVFRDAGRRLSAERDSKAAVEAFDRLRACFAGDWLPREFAKIRRALAARASGPVDVAIVDDLRNVLFVEHGQIAAWTVDEMSRNDLWSAVRRSRRRCRRAMDEAIEEPSPARFHEWRKRTKTFWYHVRFLSEVGVAKLDEDADQLQKLSRMLGEHHDLTMIDDLCRRSPEVFGTDRYVDRFRKFVTRRLRQLEATAEALGSEILAGGARAWEARVTAGERQRI